MILPKSSDVQKAKAQERKSQIDEGLVLARRIDELRGMRLQMERNFEEWRQGTSKVIQKEINELTEERDDMALKVIEARKSRDLLLMPLDTEWNKLNEERKSLNKDKNEAFLDEERIKGEMNKIDDAKAEVSLNLNEARSLKKDIQKEKEEIKKLNLLSKNEYAKAVSHRERIESECDKKMSEVNQIKNQYEVGVKTNEIREKQMEEKESELSIRENDLARRIKNLQRAEGIN